MNYLPLRITRPLLGSSGGDYSLILSSVLHVSSFTSPLLKQILCLFSVCRNWLTSRSVPGLISQNLNASTFCYRADENKLNVSTSHQSVVGAYFCGAHCFGHSRCGVVWSQRLTPDGFENRLQKRCGPGLSWRRALQRSGSHRVLTEPLLEGNLPPWHTNCLGFTVPFK